MNMPLSHRLLLCVLFREIRLLTRTLKSSVQYELFLAAKADQQQIAQRGCLP